MKTILILAAVFALFFIARRLLSGSVLSPAEAARRVAAGAAVLIDVREPDEWSGGVVRGALLLPLGDLRGARKLWQPVLNANRDKELICYCRSGARSGMAVRILSSEKLQAANAGGFPAWQLAGSPLERPVQKAD